MAKSKENAETTARILAMRAAGEGVREIAHAVALSERQVNRILTKAGNPTKGQLLPAMNDAVIQGMVETVRSDERLRELLASLAADVVEGIAGSRARLKKAQTAVDLNPPQTTREYLELARAESASATAGKLQLDTLRQLLGHANRLHTQDDIPELIIRELTTADIERLREEQDELDAMGMGAEPAEVSEMEDDVLSYP
jgi:hypothetical protein